MKAVILTQFFPPEMGAAQNRLNALAQAFVRRGHDLTIVTALPNYPTGRIYSQYQNHYKTCEDFEGMKIIRTWLYVHPSRRLLPTALSYLTFAFTALNVGAREIKSADLLLWEYPPIFLGHTAQKLANKWGARLITNFADLWTDAMEENGTLSFKPLLQYLRKQENELIRKSSLITGQTDGILRNLEKRSSTAKPVLWPNGADIELFQPQITVDKVTQKYNPTHKFVVGYAGLHGRIHDLQNILESAKLLQAEEDIKFVLIGDGFEKANLIKYAQDNNLENVSFYDPVKHSKLPEVLASFNIGLVTHKNLPSLKAVRSAKMFEMMAMELPILYCGDSEGSEIVRQASAGIVITDNNPRTIANSIIEMKKSSELKKWGVNGRNHVRQNFDRKKISDNLVKTIEEHLSS